METKNSNRSAESFFDNENPAMKTFKEASSQMLETYRKQLTLASEFYSNVFNSFFSPNRNNWNPARNYVDLFFNNNDVLRSMTNPFGNFNSNGSLNSISNTFDKIVKQITDYNLEMMGAFGKQLEDWNANWSELNEKYRQTVQKRLESSKEIIHSIADNYNKQAEFSFQNNKKLIEDINKQVDIVFKVNQQFWTDVVNSMQPSSQEENAGREQVHNNVKKPSKVTAEI